jgi:uncharacterized protein YgbK (DUF1537 family)
LGRFRRLGPLRVSAPGANGISTESDPRTSVVIPMAFRLSSGRKEQARSCEAALAALARHQHVAITVPQDFGSGLPKRFANFLGQLLHGIRSKQWLGGIFVSGGSTAEAVCDSLRVDYLQVGGEVRPGIAWSFMVDGLWPGLPLISKAGGFGGADEVRGILKEISS